MSAKKVSKHIREHKRQLRRAAKQREKAPQNRHSRHAARAARGERVGRGAYSGRGQGVVAMVVGLALGGAFLASATLDILGDQERAAMSLAPHTVSAPGVTEKLVCPPMPGQPDSVTEDGILDYAERDDSAKAEVRSLILPADSQLSPAGEWAELTEEGREDAQTVSGIFAAEDVAGSSVLEVAPQQSQGQEPAVIAGFTHHADSGTVSGLTSATCIQPQRTQWFLGAETGSGAISLLTLANPHDRPATAEVSSFDSDGDRGPLGATTVLIPEQSVRSVNLAALTDQDIPTTVQVTASGAPVAAHLQSTVADGAQGLGTELLPGLTSAGQSHHMPGILTGDDTVAPAQLWIYVPDADYATVELQVFDDDGQVAIDTPGVFSVEGHEVVSLNLNGLNPGTYDVVMHSDEPTFAAVRSAGDGTPISIEVESDPDPFTGETTVEEEEAAPAPDISWSPSAVPLTEGSGALLPAEGDTALRIFASPENLGVATASVSLRLVDSEGTVSEPLTEELSAGTGTTIDPQALADHAEETGLSDLYAVVFDQPQIQAYAVLITRDEEGRFTLTDLRPLAGEAPQVLLYLQR